MRDSGSRDVFWDGAYNARDLGPLTTDAGETTAIGAVFRSASLDGLTPQGWSQLLDAGVRTVIDLRNADERTPGPEIPAGITVHHQPVEDQSDVKFMRSWGDRLTSPDYYRVALDLWPGKVAAVFTAIAAAPPGGVVVHCASGRDRTGMIVAMLLRLVGAPVPVVVDDYAVSLHAVNAHLSRQAQPREKPLAAVTLTEVEMAKRAALWELLEDLDVTAYLEAAGVTEQDLGRVVDRLHPVDGHG